jgi:hypothetical protein
MSNGCLLLVELTDSYAASIKQPICSGCFIERLPPNTYEGARIKRFNRQPLHFIAGKE